MIFASAQYLVLCLSARFMNIGIAGASGSFSEEAAHDYIRKNGISEYAIEYLLNAKNVLSYLDEGKIDLGVFAIENSNGGVVVEYLPAIAEHTFSIKNIFEIPVAHMLLVVPGTQREDITTISSQDQALRQCRTYLKRSWPDAEVLEYVDTATAAKDLGGGVLPKTTAVIAPRSCAALYNLDILEESIQDLKFNFTTFLAVEPKQSTARTQSHDSLESLQL